MARVKDSNGRDVYISVYGKYEDDIQIDEAFYDDEVGGDVPDEEIDFIFDNYSDAIYDDWFENQVGAAEAWGEGDR